MSTRDAMREGFEEQRERGVNVDWFTWQIAWHDASAIALEEAARMFDGKGVFAQCGDVIRALSKAEGA